MCQHANPANRKILLRLSEAISGLLLMLRRFVLGEERYWNRLSDRLESTCRHTLSPDQLQDRPELIGSDSEVFIQCADALFRLRQIGNNSGELKGALFAAARPGAQT